LRIPEFAWPLRRVQSGSLFLNRPRATAYSPPSRSLLKIAYVVRGSLAFLLAPG